VQRADLLRGQFDFSVTDALKVQLVLKLIGRKIFHGFTQFRF
jgi:hypothetical protein